MQTSDIIQQRLINQQVANTKFKKVEDLVKYMGAMQAQEWPHAKWAIGLRLPGSTDAGIEKAFNEARILRTHVLRPTWHFVHPADIRWMLQLTGPRVQAFNKSFYNKLGLDTKIMDKGIAVFEKILAGTHLDRNVIREEFVKAKLPVNDMRLICLLMYAELEGVICSGPRVGKQFTYALLDERAPAAKKIEDDEALAQLTKTYFSTRGPASLHDYVWWSGLMVKQCRDGISMLGAALHKEIVNGKELFFYPSKKKLNPGDQTTYLVPDYDEYGIAYKDRSVISDSPYRTKEAPKYKHSIVLNGQLAGTWNRTVKGEKTIIEIAPFKSLDKQQLKEVDAALAKYRNFLG